MTEQIKYKIGEQEVSVEYDEYESTRITRELLEDLIKGRCMWEEVLQELEEFDEREYLKDEGHRFGFNEGICYAMELINQKLAEIEE